MTHAILPRDPSLPRLAHVETELPSVIVHLLDVAEGSEPYSLGSVPHTLTKLVRSYAERYYAMTRAYAELEARAGVLPDDHLDAPEVLARYLHHEGDLYVVVGVSERKWSGGKGSRMVTYRAFGGDRRQTWTRTLAEFSAPVARGVATFTRHVGPAPFSQVGKGHWWSTILERGDTAPRKRLPIVRMDTIAALDRRTAEEGEIDVADEDDRKAIEELWWHFVDQGSEPVFTFSPLPSETSP